MRRIRYNSLGAWCMFRYLILTLLICFSGLDAYAWKYLTHETFDRNVSAGGCQDRTNYKRCVSAWGSDVRAEDGGTARRYLLSRHDVTGAELEGLLRDLNVSSQTYLNYARGAGGQDAAMKDMDWFARRLVLHGLLDADGKTQLLPPQYLSIYPVSDTLAFVRRLDNAFGLVLIGDAPVFKPVDFDWDQVVALYGSLESIPMMILFKAKSDAPGLEKYFLVDAKGEPTLTIDRVVPRDEAGTVDIWGKPSQLVEFGSTGNGQSYAAFDGGTLAFPVRTEEGTDISVFVKTQTLDVDRIGPPFELVRVGTPIRESLDFSPNNKFIDAAMMKVGTLDSGHGKISGDMYLPLDAWDGAAKLDHRVKGEKIIGMVPVYLTTPAKHARGWVIVYGDDTRRWYKLVAHAPDKSDFDTYQAPVADELAPMEALVHAQDYMPVADIWFGTVEKDLFTETFKDVDAQDMTWPGLRFAVRLFTDPENPETSEITDWVDTGDNVLEMGIRKTAIETAYAKAATLPGHAFDPQALVTPALITAAWEDVNTRRRERFEREFPYAERKAYAESLLARAQLANADKVLQSGQSIRSYAPFYSVAKANGGKYLKAYWREYGQLPFIEDSGEICRRFGSASEECALVWPNAQRYYDEQNAKAERDAERYAKEWLDRQYKPGWNALPPNNERRCYNNYDGTETCFFD